MLVSLSTAPVRASCGDYVVMGRHLPHGHTPPHGVPSSDARGTSDAFAVHWPIAPPEPAHNPWPGRCETGACSPTPPAPTGSDLRWRLDREAVSTAFADPRTPPPGEDWVSTEVNRGCPDGETGEILRPPREPMVVDPGDVSRVRPASSR